MASCILENTSKHYITCLCYTFYSSQISPEIYIHYIQFKIIQRKQFINKRAYNNQNSKQTIHNSLQDNVSEYKIMLLNILVTIYITSDHEETFHRVVQFSFTHSCFTTGFFDSSLHKLSLT